VPWNEQLPGDLRVHPDDLREGDVVVALSHTSDKEDLDHWFDPFGYEETFLRLEPDPHFRAGVCRDDKGNVSVTRFYGYDKKPCHVWIRARKGSMRPTSVYNNNTRWNGKCRCGANTYTSCFFVDHEGECRT